MVRPRFRYDSSRSRCDRISKLNSVPLKISGIGLERHLGAALLGDADGRELVDRIAAPVLLIVGLAVALDLQLQQLRQRVDHRDADAVQTARNLVVE